MYNQCHRTLITATVCESLLLASVAGAETEFFACVQNNMFLTGAKSKHAHTYPFEGYIEKTIVGLQRCKSENLFRHEQGYIISLS